MVEMTPYSKVIETCPSDSLVGGDINALRAEQIDSLALMISSKFRDGFRRDPNRFLDQGLCVANFPLNDLYEQLIFPGIIERVTASKHSINFTCTKCLMWVSIEHANVQEALAAIDAKNDPKIVDAAAKQIIPYLDQYFLLCNRLAFLGGSPESNEISMFLFSLGKLVANSTFRDYCYVRHIREPIGLDKQIAYSLRENRYQEVFEKIAIEAICSGMLTDIILAMKADVGMVVQENLRGVEDGRATKAIRKIAKWLMFLDKNFRRCHLHLFMRKDKFENTLPLVLNHTDGDTESIVRTCLELHASDGYSFEAYKRTFGLLWHARKLKSAKKFHDERHKRYGNSATCLALAKFYTCIEAHDYSCEMFEVIFSGQKKQPDKALIHALIISNLKRGNYRNAIRWCKRVLKFSRNDEAAYNLIGICYKKRNQTRSAIRYYKKGLRIHPYSYRLYHNLAIALAKVGKHRESKKMLDKAAKLKNIS